MASNALNQSGVLAASTRAELRRSAWAVAYKRDEGKKQT